MYAHLYHQPIRVARADGTETAAATTTGSSEWRGVGVINAIANGLSSIGDLFTGWGVAKGNNTTTSAGTTTTIPENPQKSNTGLWMGIGLAVLVLIGILFWVLKRKK